MQYNVPYVKIKLRIKKGGKRYAERKFDENLTQKNKIKATSVISAILLCLLTLICVLLSAAVIFLSLSKTPENTLEVLDYKIYCAENNIEEIGVKAGSLVVVRDTDSDDYYTYESLSENIVFSVERLGYAIKYNSLWMTLCITVPLMLFFLINLMSGFKKLSIEAAEKKLASELELDANAPSFSSENDFDVTV